MYQWKAAGTERMILGDTVVTGISASGQHPVTEDFMTLNHSSKHFEKYLTYDTDAIKICEQLSIDGNQDRRNW